MNIKNRLNRLEKGKNGKVVLLCKEGRSGILYTPDQAVQYFTERQTIRDIYHPAYKIKPPDYSALDKIIDEIHEEVERMKAPDYRLEVVPIPEHCIDQKELKHMIRAYRPLTDRPIRDYLSSRTIATAESIECTYESLEDGHERDTTLIDALDQLIHGKTYHIYEKDRFKALDDIVIELTKEKERIERENNK